jgi:four helix bundle protein
VKHQTSIAKPQRTSKIQASKPHGAFKYSHTADATLLLNEAPTTNGASKHPFDLEERTAKFGEAIVRFSKKIPRNPTNDRLIDQLVGCGTSVGGNYCEADERVSRKDFRNVIGRCAKEAKETKYFLRMVVASEPTLAAEAAAVVPRSERIASHLRDHLPKRGVSRLMRRYFSIGDWSLVLLWGLGFGVWGL